MTEAELKKSGEKLAESAETLEKSTERVKAM